MKIGNNIASRRKELGMTQQELADKLYISVKTVSKWETNRGNPDMNILPALAAALDMEISDLFQDNNPEEQDNHPKEKIPLDIVKGYVELGFAFLGLIFFIMTFFTKEITGDIIPQFPFFGDILSGLSVDISGYEVLFKLSGANGSIISIGAWVAFLIILAHIGFGILELLPDARNTYKKKNKAAYILTVIGFADVIAIIILALAAGFGIATGSIMIAILYGALWGFRIYDKKTKNIENNI